jgi:hypothetical protein
MVTISMPCVAQLAPGAVFTLDGDDSVVAARAYLVVVGEAVSGTRLVVSLTNNELVKVPASTKVRQVFTADIKLSPQL